MTANKLDTLRCPVCRQINHQAQVFLESVECDLEYEDWEVEEMTSPDDPLDGEPAGAVAWWDDLDRYVDWLAEGLVGYG